MKSNDFKDKVTIITGGGSGIGEAMCKHFADKKAKVSFLITMKPKDAESLRKTNPTSLSAISLMRVQWMMHSIK